VRHGISLVEDMLQYPPQSVNSDSLSMKHILIYWPLEKVHAQFNLLGLVLTVTVTPGISAQEYHERRAKLAAKLPKDAIAILPASDLKYRSGAVFYEFHQDPDFFYLTGFNEQEAVAVIQKVGEADDYIFHLFLRPKDPKAEQWDGARSGEQAAKDVFNADMVGLFSKSTRLETNLHCKTGNIANITNLLSPLIAGASEIYAAKFDPRSWFHKFFNPEKGGAQALLKDKTMKPIRHIMNELRVFKSEAEIKNMRFAGKVSGRAITNAMRQQWTKEKDLWAFLDYGFRIGGCDTYAYVPVIAGGKNALSIHYVRNDDLLKEDDMVLVDAGGQYGGYITDITRTWPVSKRFSAPQKDLYEMILRVQRSSISLCRDDANLSLDKIHQITEHGLREGLKDLGFDVGGNTMEILFPHHVGHYVGLDVHDCPGYSRAGALKAGQCVTIEPGIYVPNDERFPQHFRGLGIRIEDSICVQDDTALVLTTEAVKEVVDIEALRD
jgi:intermediate cleaving peptidase 55